MSESVGALWNRARAPQQGFRDRCAARPALGEALRGLLAARTGPAFLSLVLSWLGFSSLYQGFLHLDGPAAQALLDKLPEGVSQADVRALLQGLPPLPSWGHVLPWLVLLAPLGVLSLWLHDAVWDHLCLWLLRGLRRPKSLGLTLVADAEALKVGALGTAVGLLGDLPGVGCLFTALLLPVGIYFWVLRGFALAAWHGCPLWKGITATLIHGALALILALGTLFLFLGFTLWAIGGA